jgi:glycosyltransferase involved in cell wall biosynthesis
MNSLAILPFPLKNDKIISINGMNDMPLISILTPVFNGETYLRSCIESVLAQTFQDLEYIVVDNCSQDATPDIIREFASQDKRIRVVTNKSFAGIIENHNIAYSQINPQARYCKIVQADDIIFPECLETFARLCEENPSVTLVSAKRMIGELESTDYLPASRSVFQGREIGRAFFYNKWPDIFGSPTSYFLKADVIRMQQPFYNPHNLFADQEACIKVLINGDFGFIHEVLSLSRRQEGSEYSKSGYLRISYPSYLWTLVNHGRAFLSEDEYLDRLRGHLRQYYCVMARDLINLRRGLRYWRYHFVSLRKIGYPFNPLRLLATMARLPGEKRRNRETSEDRQASREID